MTPRFEAEASGHGCHTAAPNHTAAVTETTHAIPRLMRDEKIATVAAKAPAQPPMATTATSAPALPTVRSRRTSGGMTAGRLRAPRVQTAAARRTRARRAPAASETRNGA